MQAEQGTDNHNSLSQGKGVDQIQDHPGSRPAGKHTHKRASLRQGLGAQGKQIVGNKPLKALRAKFAKEQVSVAVNVEKLYLW